MQFTGSVLIQAKPDEVFGYVADFTRHGEWANSPLAIKAVSDGPVGVGATFQSDQEFRGKPVSADIKVTIYDPPSKLQFIASEPEVDFEHTFTFVPEGDGTRVTRTNRGNPVRMPAAKKLISTLLLPLFKGTIQKDMDTTMGKLKATIETGQR